MDPIDFLLLNGYEETTTEHSGPDLRQFARGDNFPIDIITDDPEIVFISEWGDFLHIPYNVYALIGALMQLRQVSISYNWNSKELV